MCVYYCHLCNGHSRVYTADTCSKGIITLPSLVHTEKASKRHMQGVSFRRHPEMLGQSFPLGEIWSETGEGDLFSLDILGAV